jgi:asparagine synthase (glutamine-hydrolysing)
VIKVALSGDGGDESFGGYRWYSHLEGNRYLRGSKYFVESVRRRLGAGRPSPNGSANALEYRRFLTSPSFSVGEILRLFPWLKPDACRAALEETSRRFNTDAKGYKRWQLLDALTYLVDNNLFRVDRASMAHSLEVRVPFVDHRLVEFAFSLPDRLCVARNETKVLLRHEVKSRLPAPIATRGKQGFSFPLNSLWPLERMAASVRDGDLVRQGMIDAKELTRLLNERTTGHWPYKVWLLAVLEHWCRRWFGGSVA